jgi:hypothetical protein
MTRRSSIPRLMDIIEACEIVRAEVQGVTLEAFEADIRSRWVAER